MTGPLWESGREVPVHPWCKHWVQWAHWVRGTVLLYQITPSPGWYALSQGRRGAYAWVPGLYVCAQHRQRGPSLSRVSLADTKVCCVIGGEERLGEQHPELPESVRRVQTLLSAWPTPTGSLPMSHGGYFACRCPQLVHRRPPHSMCLTHTNPHPEAGSLFMSPRAASTSLCRQLVSTHRKPARLCRIGRKHTNLNI